MKKKLNKVKKVLHEYKEGDLHSGSKKGPKVKNPKQAVAIALSEARKAGEKVEAPKKGKKKMDKAEKTLNKERKLHKKEDKLHKKEENVMKKDVNVHKALKKIHKRIDKK